MSKREINKRRVRDSILAACGKLFRSRGFDETTIPDIMEAAGVSRQTFFNYFAGKEAVLTELGLTWLRQQAEIPSPDSRPRQAGSFLAGTREAIRSQVQMVKRDPKFMRLVFTRSGLLFPQQTDITADTQHSRTEYTRAIFGGVARIMEAAQQAGEVRDDISALQIAEMYVSQMLMTMRFWLINYWDDDMDLEERAMKALDVLEAGLKAGAQSDH